jgi:hypothetical protein
MNGVKMSQENKQDVEGTEYPTPKELQAWLENEIECANKATELRIKDASRLVNAYARGELNAAEAARLGHDYEQRWGEALPGVWTPQGMTDQQILATVDEARTPNYVDRITQGRVSPSRGKKRS